MEGMPTGFQVTEAMYLYPMSPDAPSHFVLRSSERSLLVEIQQTEFDSYTLKRNRLRTIFSWKSDQESQIGIQFLASFRNGLSSGSIPYFRPIVNKMYFQIDGGCLPGLNKTTGEFSISGNACIQVDCRKELEKSRACFAMFPKGARFLIVGFQGANISLKFFQKVTKSS